jgi:hypothetical protein
MLLTPEIGHVFCEKTANLAKSGAMNEISLFGELVSNNTAAPGSLLGWWRDMKGRALAF